MVKQYSVSPTGEKFEIPEKEQYNEEMQRIRTLTNKARKDGQEVIVVMGVGFVGAVMAAIIADSTDKKGKPKPAQLQLAWAVNRLLKNVILGAAHTAINQNKNTFKDYYERDAIREQKETTRPTF